MNGEVPRRLSREHWARSPRLEKERSGEERMAADGLRKSKKKATDR
jgi:hypothetical protein